MAKALPFRKTDENIIPAVDESVNLKNLLHSRKMAQREPLNVSKVLQTPGLEHLSEQEAKDAVDSIKKLAVLFFETACVQNFHSIDNQQDVNLMNQNIAA